jgi:hypothetical protein
VRFHLADLKADRYFGEPHDLVWVDDIDLAVKIEWQTNTEKDVIDDFQKLVRVKAPLKLIVYSSCPLCPLSIKAQFWRGVWFCVGSP